MLSLNIYQLVLNFLSTDLPLGTRMYNFIQSYVRQIMILKPKRMLYILLHSLDSKRRLSL